MRRLRLAQAERVGLQAGQVEARLDGHVERAGPVVRGVEVTDVGLTASEPSVVENGTLNMSPLKRHRVARRRACPARQGRDDLLGPAGGRVEAPRCRCRGTRSGSRRRGDRRDIAPGPKISGASIGSTDGPNSNVSRSVTCGVVASSHVVSERKSVPSGTAVGDVEAEEPPVARFLTPRPVVGAEDRAVVVERARLGAAASACRRRWSASAIEPSAFWAIVGASVTETGTARPSADPFVADDRALVHAEVGVSVGTMTVAENDTAGRCALRRPRASRRSCSSRSRLEVGRDRSPGSGSSAGGRGRSRLPCASPDG